MNRPTGYTDRLSVRPADTLRFMIGLEAPARYDVEIVRVQCGDINPEGPGLRYTRLDTPVNGTYDGLVQHSHIGSWASLPLAESTLAGATGLATAVWPTLVSGRDQCLLEVGADGVWLRLVLDGAGTWRLHLAEGERLLLDVSLAAPAVLREWRLVGVMIDPAGQLGLFACDLSGAGEERTAPAPADLLRRVCGADRLALAAAGARTAGRRERHFNGKVERPMVLHGRVSHRHVVELFRQPAEIAAASPVVAGLWDFACNPAGRRVAGLGAARAGELHNLPTRGMTGVSWDGRCADWREGPAQYGAIHFHEDDIADIGWQQSFALTIPENWSSGLYAARLTCGAAEDFVPFFVRPPTGKAANRVAVLASTFTYIAYANERGVAYLRGCELLIGRLRHLSPLEVYLYDHPEYGLSLYDTHRDGSYVAYSSRLRPMVNQRPKAQTWTAPPPSMVRWLNQDTHLLHWLETQGFDYDILTDEDLHAEGAGLIAPYSVVITSSHPEYFSAAMLDAFAAYKAAGGRLMYLGGNGACWRTDTHDEWPGAIEVRRSMNYTARAHPGELHHVFSGERGGFWSSLGRPEQETFGVGFVSEGFDSCGHFVRAPASFEPRVAFIFDGIEAHEPIGDFGFSGGGAAGVEIDATLGQAPHGALLLAVSTGLSDNYYLGADDVEHAQLRTPSLNPSLRAEMLYFETPNDGAVFAASSIAWSTSLNWNGGDNNVSRLTANVLRHFLRGGPGV